VPLIQWESLLGNHLGIIDDIVNRPDVFEWR